MMVIEEQMEGRENRAKAYKRHNSLVLMIYHRSTKGKT